MQFYFDSFPWIFFRYYYLQCFNNGQGGDKGPRGRNPTSLENVASNFTQPGQFYYDRAGATISYIPRAGETGKYIIDKLVIE